MRIFEGTQENYMIKFYKIFLIAGIIFLSIGFILELIYWIYLKDIVWIASIYPPPEIVYWIRIVPFLGFLFILIGSFFFIVGFWLFLEVDLEKLQKAN